MNSFNRNERKQLFLHSQKVCTRSGWTGLYEDVVRELVLSMKFWT